MDHTGQDEKQITVERLWGKNATFSQKHAEDRVERTASL